MKIIVLGTAHLDTTLGKSSPDWEFRECEYSRKVCEEVLDRLKTSLNPEEYSVVFDWHNLEAPAGVAHPNQKVQQQKELNYRVRRVNDLCARYGKENVIYVSIHVNAAGDGHEWMNAGGWSCYTSPGQTRSDQLAECLYDAADVCLSDYKKIMSIGKENGAYGKRQKAVRTETVSDGDRDFEKDYAVLTRTLCTAVLTENLFMDNRTDVAFLQSEEGFEAIVQLHVVGIKRFVHLRR